MLLICGTPPTMSRPGALWGILGCLLMLADSAVLGGHGLEGAEAWREGLRASASIDVISTFIAGALGSAGACVALMGLTSLYRAMEPAGRGIAWIAACGLGAWLVLLGAHHAARPLVAHLIRVEPLALDSLMFARALAYVNVHRSFAGVGLFFGSLFFFFGTLFRPTELPRWCVALTPLLLIPGVFAFRTAPAPIAGMGIAGWADIVMLPLFVALLFVPRPERAQSGPPLR